MDVERSDQFYRAACERWDFLRCSYSPDEPDWSSTIHDILGDLQQSLKCDPNNLKARELRVRLIGDELGAYAEAFPEADELHRRAPDNAEYRELRERIRVRAKEYWPATPDE